MAYRILIIELDSTDPAVWRYGLADTEGTWLADARRLWHDVDTCATSIDPEAEMLWPTVILLVRQAGQGDRVVYDLARRPVERGPGPPHPPSERRWERSTSKRHREAGETLGERADRDRRGGSRAAA